MTTNKDIFGSGVEVVLPLEKNTVRTLGRLGCDELVEAYKDFEFAHDDNEGTICTVNAYFYLDETDEADFTFTISNGSIGEYAEEITVNGDITEVAAMFLKIKIYSHMRNLFAPTTEAAETA